LDLRKGEDRVSLRKSQGGKSQCDKKQLAADRFHIHLLKRRCSWVDRIDVIHCYTTFDQLKTLAGTWQGHVSTTPVKGGMEGTAMQVTLRPTSMGNAIMHEMKGAGRPDDPITMLYLENDTLILTHYCDAGNRPRMVGKLSADGKTVQFDFLDVAGSTQYGHMQSATFTM
jgi:hypothetical protein